MPPPLAYQSTYRTYKAGTEKLTTWLVDNARRCKVDLSFLENKTSKYEVPLDQFQPLAKAIVASTDPKIRISRSIIGVINSVIALRKHAASYFAQWAGLRPTNRAIDQSHSHFITVLENVLGILKPTYQADTGDTKLPEVTNLFDALHLEDPVSEGTAPKPKTGKVTKYEPETTKFDLIFAFFAYFKDMNELRAYIRVAWRFYKDRRINLMSVAVTTDTAFNLMKRATEDLVNSSAYCEAKNKSKPPNAAQLAEGPPDHIFMVARILGYLGIEEETSMDVADLLGLPANDHLREFGKVLAMGDGVPVYKPGYLGTYYPSRDRSEMSDDEQHQEDLIVLMEFLPEVAKLARFGGRMPTHDEWTDALFVMMNGRRVHTLPPFAVFATASFLDIHHILRDEASRPFDEMQATGHRAVAVLDDHFRYSRNRRIDTWPARFDEPLKRLHKEVKECILTDQLATVLPDVGGVRPKPFHLLKNHPVLCGLLTFRINCMLNDFGVAVANAWGSAMYPLHPYNATRQSGDLDITWDDAEYIISVHSPQRIFVGAPPTAPIDYFKRFVLALGGSATMFARNRRPGGRSLPVESKKGPRGLKVTTPVKDIFRPRYVENTGPAVLLASNLIAMPSVASKAERTSGTMVDLESFNADMINKQQLTTMQFLDLVREGIAAEELHLLFDYFGLHQRGYKLLRTLQTHLQDDMVRYFGSSYIENESELPFLVGYIFEVVAGSARVAEVLRARYGGSRMLGKAAEVMRGFLLEGENGSKSIDRARALSNAVVLDLEGDG